MSKGGSWYLISVTSDLSSFCSSSLAASRMGMTSASAVSASVFSTAIILFCSSISMAFSSASFFFSSAAGGGAGEKMPGCRGGNLSRVGNLKASHGHWGEWPGGSGQCDGHGCSHREDSGWHFLLCATLWVPCQPHLPRHCWPRTLVFFFCDFG